MKHAGFAVFTSGLLIAAMTACGPQPDSSAPSSAPEAAPDTPAAVTPESAQTNLLTYDGPASRYPITAQYPDTMQVDGGCAGEGCGFFFTFVPQGNALDEAELHIFLPAGATTAADQEPFVTGPNGLIENAGWTVDSVDENGSEAFPYGWVDQVINFSTDQEQSGHILLGQAEGQAVQVVLLYPAEMSDSYWPGANTVLESLEFDADLLPLERSNV